MLLQTFLSFYLTMFRQNNILPTIPFLTVTYFLSHNVQTKQCYCRNYNKWYRTVFLSHNVQTKRNLKAVEMILKMTFLSHNVQTKHSHELLLRHHIYQLSISQCSDKTYDVVYLPSSVTLNFLSHNVQTKHSI